jgi:hypothetical protein
MMNRGLWDTGYSALAEYDGDPWSEAKFALAQSSFTHFSTVMTSGICA